MDESYEGREQSAAKHLILENYLDRLAYKVGYTQPDLTLNYIDGFAGPWASQTPDLSDTSPSLALRTLLKARDGLAAVGRHIDVRAFFVSTTQGGASQLRSLRERFPAATIEVVTGTFEKSLEAAGRFARYGRNCFAFIFIDHTGWRGFGLREIAPLMNDGSNEVLINFMTGFITRFIDGEDGRYEESFVDLFGDRSFREAWRGLEGLDREDRIVETYCRRVAHFGNYRHCVSSVVLNPRINRSHFHLVYGTRSDEGLVTFRNVERDVLKVQREGRADVRQKQRIKRTGHPELFGALEQVSRTYEDELRDRYRARAFATLDDIVGASPDGALWDDMLAAGLRIPMIAEADVKEWLHERKGSHAVEVRGLGPRERVPKRKQQHRVRRAT